ncbi:iron reductase domain protein [Acrodontium crateriforme]|uniref:Iron reductase domain protein n=1 Tax=Acrodontium crateriforme TaxID=150365 RepID=A0AAQ3LZ29_9PEZI|nr:iron reductase domain protein [Acrodontium crateriforme]
MKASTTVTSAVLSLGVGVAALTQQCPQKGICYSLAIPESTAQSGNGDIFFQLSAPTQLQWVGLGQGGQMAGANMFVMYAAADGKNVTISPRLGKGEVMPLYDSDTSITLLEGSGIENGLMVANVRCSNCNSWEGGSMDLTGSGDSDWIFAYKVGSSLNTDKQDQYISKHDLSGSFNIPLAAAKGGHDVNPFVTAASTGTASGTATGTASSIGTASSSPTQSSTVPSSSSTSDGGDIPIFAQPKGFAALSDDKQNMIIVIHGAMAAIAWVALFPLGGIVMRLIKGKSTIWMHAGIQMLALSLFTAAAGIGIWMASSQGELHMKHPVIGLIVFGLAWIQPVGGVIHHLLFKKTGRRSIVSHLHMNLGRICIVLGMINGGLGLQWTGVTNSALIAYVVCVGVVGIVYIASSVFGEARRIKEHRRIKSTNSRNSPNMSQTGL